MASPYEIAQRYSGLHERRDEAALQDFLYNGGRNLLPATRAWCADYMAAAFRDAGYDSTGGNASARSWMNVGKPVTEPQVGDVVVLKRGNEPWEGHVGFYQGVGPDGRIRVFGGNQGDAVGSAYYPAESVLGYRRAVPISQDAEAQPGGFYGAPVVASAAPVAVAPRRQNAPEAVEAPEGEGLSGVASKAMRLASAFTPKTQADTGDDASFLRHDHKTLARNSGGLEMAAASTPYLKRAEGGAVDDTGITVPETYQSLLAQQRQLIEGRRIAQMFPSGTEELPLPPGLERVETRRGVFHFDPSRVSAEDVVSASEAGRENEVLGLGPMSKDDVARVMRQTGEKPVAITERDLDGNEVRGSLATPSTVPIQSDEILRTADPRNRVDVEPVDDVVSARAMRIARSDGGAVAENKFEVLTPEQKAAINRDKIDESLGPFDFMPGAMTGVGAGIGMLGSAYLLKDALRYGGWRYGLKELPISSIPTAGGAAIGYLMDKKDPAVERMNRENGMLFGDPRDAEAQPGYMERRAAGGGIGRAITGALAGATGGRADKIPGTARAGSHVIPADIVSYMGQGNTNAGLKALERMFSTGPYGMTLRSRRRADGGGVDEEIPVMLSDGEYVIAPEIVAELGGGDVQTGHDVLDGWIMHERQNAIRTLASLPPPATD